MDKKTLLAVLVSIGILIGYNTLLSKVLPRKDVSQSGNPEQAAPSRGIAKSTEIGKSNAITYPQAEISADIIKEYDMGSYTFSISLTTGVIKSIFLQDFSHNILVTNVLSIDTLPKDVVYKVQVSEKNLKIIGFIGGEAVIEKTISLVDDYAFKARITFLRPALSPASIGLQISRDPDANYARYQEVFFKNEYIRRTPLANIKKLVEYQDVKYVGYRDTYFCLVVAPADFRSVLSANSQKASDNSALVSWPVVNEASEFLFYVGPQDVKLLKQYQFGDIVNYGFFHPVSLGILYILAFVQGLVNSWGLSIIIVTIIINIILFPLTKQSTKSMKQMQSIQKDIEKLRTKYTDNPQKLNKEIMEMYKVNRINPLAGCLPWLLQIPFFFGFFQILNRYISIRGSHFLWITDLSQPDQLFKLPLVLPFGFGEHFNILPLLLIGIMFFQQKITMVSSGSQNDQQKMLMIILPIIMGLVFYKFSAALVIYWITNSVTMTYYQYRLLKSK